LLRSRKDCGPWPPESAEQVTGLETGHQAR